MNADKFSAIQQKISNAEYISKKSAEPAEKFFGEPQGVKNKIAFESSEIENERQKIKSAVFDVKNNFGELEKIAFPESMPESAINILERQAKMVKFIDATQNEIHKKFLEYQQESRENFVSD